jgi:hypothetical protein
MDARELRNGSGPGRGCGRIISCTVPIRRFGGGREEEGKTKMFLGRGGCRRISDGTRVLDIAADNMGAKLGKGARSTSTIASEVEQTHRGGGVRPQKRGGQPRREERHGQFAPILDKPPPEKNSQGGFCLRPYPGHVMSEPARSYFITQPLLFRYRPSA